MGTRNLVLVAMLAAALGLAACTSKSEKSERPSAFAAGHAVTQGQSGGH